MRTLVIWIEKISAAGGIFAAFLLIPLVLTTCYEVIARYLFGAPTSWAYELGYMLTGWSFVFACAYTLRQEGHIRIDVIYNRFPPRTRAALSAAGYLLLLPVIGWLCHGLFSYAAEAYSSGEHTGQSAWNPPAWPFRFMIALGFTLLALQTGAELLKALYLAVTGRPLLAETAARRPS